MCRKIMGLVTAIGVLLIAAPFVLGLPGKGADGAKMINAFEPLMAEANVQQTTDYYDNVFVPLGAVAPAMSRENVDRFNAYLAGIGATSSEANQLVPELSAATGMSEAQVQAYLGTKFPAMSQMLQGLPTMEQDFGGLLGLMDANVDTFAQVPAGLEHYDPLVRTVGEQRTNFESVASLPDFRLFTWFFVVPGALLMCLGIAGLFTGRASRSIPAPRLVEADDALAA